jgi:hypothetical protein
LPLGEITLPLNAAAKRGLPAQDFDFAKLAQDVSFHDISNCGADPRPLPAPGLHGMADHG